MTNEGNRINKQQVLNLITNATGVLIGQHIGFDLTCIESPTYKYNYAHQITNLAPQTGQLPAIIAFSYGFNYTLAQMRRLNKYATDYWNAGGLIQIDFALPNPWTGGDWRDPRPKGKRLIELVTPGNTAYNNWQAQIASYRAGLAELCASGVVPIIVPAGELTYNDSTWQCIGENYQRGNRIQELADFLAWWTDFYNRTSDLNVLRLYEAGQNEPWVPADAAWPPTGMADIAGISMYSTPSGKSVEHLARHGVPVAFSQFGGPKKDGTDDLVTRIAFLKTYPQVKYVIHWHSWPEATGLCAIADQVNAFAYMNNPYTLTLKQPEGGAIMDVVTQLTQVEIALRAKAASIVANAAADSAALIAQADAIKQDIALLLEADTTMNKAADAIKVG